MSHKMLLEHVVALDRVGSVHVTYANHAGPVSPKVWTRVACCRRWRWKKSPLHFQSRQSPRLTVGSRVFHPRTRSMVVGSTGITLHGYIMSMQWIHWLASHASFRPNLTGEMDIVSKTGEPFYTRFVCFCCTFMHVQARHGKPM